MVTAVTSRTHAGKPLSKVVPALRGIDQGLCFVDSDPATLAASETELFFLALPHGAAATYAKALVAAGKKVIDLSADFRLRDPAVYEEFYGHPHPAPDLLDEAVYGLPEIRAEEMQSARLIASPGCYPTSILLPLLPLLHPLSHAQLCTRRAVAECLREDGFCDAW